MLVLFTIYLVKLEYFDRHNSHNCILLRTDVVYNNTTIGHATKKTGSSYCAHLHRTNGLLWMNYIILEHLAVWSTMTCFSYLSLHMHEQSSLQCELSPDWQKAGHGDRELAGISAEASRRAAGSPGEGRQKERRMGHPPLHRRCIYMRSSPLSLLRSL